MALSTKAVLGILHDNLERRRSVLPLNKRALTRWADGLGIPEGGETIIYTGHMYQLVPTMRAMAALMARLEDSRLASFMDLGRLVNRFINISWFMARPSRAEREATDLILRNIALLLRAAGVEFGYLYDRELYAGALAHDEGLDEIFTLQARRVHALLEESGVRRVITVDPHTTNILRSVYPEFIEDFDVEVVSYLEVLAKSDMSTREDIGGEVVVHDSCVYARCEDVVDEPRRLLMLAGATIAEPRQTGKYTQCCGGPIESLFPGRAHEIAMQRVDQLSKAGHHVATMCPICLLNLREASNGNGVVLDDISSFLARALLETPTPGGL